MKHGNPAELTKTIWSLMRGFLADAPRAMSAGATTAPSINCCGRSRSNQSFARQPHDLRMPPQLAGKLLRGELEMNDSPAGRNRRGGRGMQEQWTKSQQAAPLYRGSGRGSPGAPARNRVRRKAAFAMRTRQHAHRTILGTARIEMHANRDPGPPATRGCHGRRRGEDRRRPAVPDCR
jgi:hypothetical protein